MLAGHHLEEMGWVLLCWRRDKFLWKVTLWNAAHKFLLRWFQYIRVVGALQVPVGPDKTCEESVLEEKIGQKCHKKGCY